MRQGILSGRVRGDRKGTAIESEQAGGKELVGGQGW